jgi:hypothetical protein
VGTIQFNTEEDKFFMLSTKKEDNKGRTRKRREERKERGK